jgi:branched-chain amino acid transport system permease protein
VTTANLANRRASHPAKRAGRSLARVSGSLFVPAGVLGAALLLPETVGVASLDAWTTCAIFAIAACGVGVLYGWLGLTSLTQVALGGVGAWVTMRLAFATGLPFLVEVAVGGLVTSAIGLLLALPALKVRGLRLALVTLMIAGGFDVVFNATGFPNGGGGFLGYQASGELQRLPRPSFAASDAAYFRLVVSAAALSFVAVNLQLGRRPGRAWALIAESEDAAAASGVSLVRSQMWAFALAAMLSGIAGGLLAGQVGQLAPSTFQVSESMVLFALVVVAGSHHWMGWVIAAVLFKVVPFALDQAHVDGNVAIMVFGVALMLNVLGSSRGAVGQVEELVGALRRKRRAGL